MTLADESITFNFSGHSPFERLYAVTGQDNQRYSLEIRDDQSAKTRVDFELAPCGLFVESEGVCDAVCQNLAAEVGVPTDEQFRDIAKQIASVQNEAAAEQIVATLRESFARGPQPIFPKRAFFVRDAQ